MEEGPKNPKAEEYPSWTQQNQKKVKSEIRRTPRTDSKARKKLPTLDRAPGKFLERSAKKALMGGSRSSGENAKMGGAGVGGGAHFQPL